MSNGWFKSNFEATSTKSDLAMKTDQKSLSRSKSEASLEKSILKGPKRTFEEHLDDSFVMEPNNSEKIQSLDWLKKFRPKENSDLAVHPKKLEELKSWIIVRTKVPNKILILEGPAGCGKTTSLKVIARENGYEINEWINSTDLETALLRESSEVFQPEFASYENQITKFTDFLLRTSRFNSLFNRGKRLLLVKDLPNTFMKKTQEFYDILKIYSEDGCSPLVFIVTDTNSKALNVAQNLFPDKIRLTLAIDTITLNSVSVTMMKRGIKRVIQLIASNSTYSTHFQEPSEEVIDSLVLQSQGDIRNAVLNLNFASQGTFISHLSKSAKQKKNKKAKSSDKRIGKNEALTLMHGLGRVFYPKLEKNTSSELYELTHNPEEISQAFSTQPSNIISLIHSNYIKHFTDIDSVTQVSSMLSLSDCFESERRDDQLQQLNLNFVIRSVMVLNKAPAGGFRAITAYANKKWKNTEELSKEKFSKASLTLNNGNIMARDDFFCDYNNFLKLIKK